MQASVSPFGFSNPTVIDMGRAGGEPTIHIDRQGTWLYTSHAGTTHLDKQNAAKAADFAVPYRNQTYLWRCAAGDTACDTDPGSWHLVDIDGTGLHAAGTGYSDPDVAEDSAGNLYHAEMTVPTGVAEGEGVTTTVNASTNDGVGWDANPHAPSGDRPWIAADIGPTGQRIVYLSNVAVSPLQPGADGGVSFKPVAPIEFGATFDDAVFTSTDGGKTFNSGTIDHGLLPDGRWMVGDGKLLVDSSTHAVYQPTFAVDTSGNEAGVGVGISRDGGTTFTEHLVANDRVYRTCPFAADLTEDVGGTLYLVWDQAQELGARCSGGRHPLAIRYAYSRDGGNTWSAPVDVTRPGVAVFWPWAAAGRGGMLGLAWYQSDKAVPVDTDSSAVRVYAAQISGADTVTPTITIADATPSPVHVGTVCQSGTGCNEQVNDDRRLGDYLTCTLDTRGRLAIAYADTKTYADSPVSRPGLVVQNAGASF